MRHTLSCWSLLGVAVATLPAQGITRSAVAATNLSVSVVSALPGGNQTQTLPLGTPLVDGTTVQASVLLALARIHVVMPTSPPLFRLECVANAGGPTGASFLGDTMLTLASPSPTAAILTLTYLASGYPSASVDVGNDGTLELSTQAGGQVQTNVLVLFGPAPLLVRTSMSGQGLKSNNATLNLEVAVSELLSASVTSYLTGCGPTIAVAPRTTQSVRISVGSLPPAGLAFVVIGLGRDHVLLPFGNCLLGLRTDWPLSVSLNPTGSGTLDIGVPSAVRSITADVQAVGLDFVSGPGTVVTSDAVEVRLSR